MKTKSEIIRHLNDETRQGKKSGSQTVITSGIQALGEQAVAQICMDVSQFDDFTGDNDPYGEHDFGAIEFAGNRIYWKIDYYDKALQYGSPDASNPDITTRVLTIMLAEEY